MGWMDLNSDAIKMHDTTVHVEKKAALSNCQAKNATEN